jgi:hypothetical protein
MWVYSELGFFSIVEKPNDIGRGTLTVRARRVEDLVALGRLIGARAGQVEASDDTDYPVRMAAPRAAVAMALAGMARAIDYDNFKLRVARTQPGRLEAYHEIHASTIRIEKKGRKHDDDHVQARRKEVRSGSGVGRPRRAGRD